jgi:hypothetical protein
LPLVPTRVTTLRKIVEIIHYTVDVRLHKFIDY